MDELDNPKEIPKPETGISLEELIKIASEINDTSTSDRGDLTNAEFAWLYTPGEKLQPLRSQAGQAAQLLMLESTFVMEAFTNTDALAVIHNHPGGTLSPSLEDINVLLRAAADNEKLDYALIAATDTGKVTGFYELKYLADRSKARDLMARNIELYRNHLHRKYEWLDQHPEVRDQMAVGDSILSSDEYTELVREAMSGSSVVGRAQPLAGFRVEKDRFVPDIP